MIEWWILCESGESNLTARGCHDSIPIFDNFVDCLDEALVFCLSRPTKETDFSIDFDSVFMKGDLSDGSSFGECEFEFTSSDIYSLIADIELYLLFDTRFIGIEKLDSLILREAFSDEWITYFWNPLTTADSIYLGCWILVADIAWCGCRGLDG